MNFSGRALLLDIEGTISSVSYVYDVLFPFALAHLESFLASAWSTPEVGAAVAHLAKEAGDAGLAHDPERVAVEVRRLMSGDVKSTSLKELQGMIWEEGFRSGELKSHVFPDVPGALERWTAAGARVCIYSSGSVKAQRLFFGHTEEGDLLHYLSGHFDTTTGGKKEPESYRKIAATMGFSTVEVLFASDVIAELDAAREAGMRTVLTLRPGNAVVESDGGHSAVVSFDEIRMGAG